ncbi:ferredoxin-type protein NapG [Sulfurimonas sp. HSL-1656]|uniref:ferredoxin-type protein NapG n=1 Tax=Thiomicrolovo TaxID=3451667 RepID=UPI0031F7C3A1
MKNEQLSDRRKFLLTMARGVGLSAMGALVWTAYVEEVKAAPLVLRPPGAQNEADFLKSCIKCGLCVEGCPYDTLKLAAPGDTLPMGTPFFTPREIPCYMCEDIPCVPVCPTGALDANKVQSDFEGEMFWDIKKIDIGVAIVDPKACIAFWGIQCDACYRACPLMDQAIKLEYEQNERTGKHAYLKPVVVPDVCTGCGMCEHACVTEKAAITILPRGVVEGHAGSHYVKGWDKKDQERVKSAKGGTTVTERSQEKAIDSLNDMGDLLE